MFPGVYSSLYWNERLGAHPFLVQCLYQLSCSCCASLKQTSALRCLRCICAATSRDGWWWQGVRLTVDDGLWQLINPPWWNKVEVYMNHSRTISDVKSWLTSAGYRHVIRNPSGMIWMDLVMSNHCRHHLRWHLIKLHRRHDQIRPKSCGSNVAFESWYFVRYLQCGSEPTLARCGWILQCQIILCIVYEDIWWNCIADTTR